jgi:hypothetical protein
MSVQPLGITPLKRVSQLFNKWDIATRFYLMVPFFVFIIMPALYLIWFFFANVLYIKDNIIASQFLFLMVT